MHTHQPTRTHSIHTCLCLKEESQETKSGKRYLEMSNLTFEEVDGVKVDINVVTQGIKSLGSKTIHSASESEMLLIHRRPAFSHKFRPQKTDRDGDTALGLVCIETIL